MKSKHKIGASILSADFANLGEDARRAEEADVDYIHIDVMDGHFVEGITWGPKIISSLNNYTSLDLDVHLMVLKPERIIDQYLNENPASISIHPESTIYTRKILRTIKEKNIKAGLALKLDTSIRSLENVIDLADYVLLLTSEEGFGGNEFSPLALDKIEDLKDLMKEKGLNLPIQVDGGIKSNNLHSLINKGVDSFVLGSAIYNENDIKENMKMLK